MSPIRTILHPTDFTGQSLEAFRAASTLSRHYGARLILLHVAAPKDFGEGLGLVPFDSEMYRDALWEKLCHQAAYAPGAAVEERLAEGDPVREILGAAEESHCDLIVMGTHGWPPLRRLLMGSVAEQVVRKAPCPVLTVKGAPAEADVA